MPPLGQNSSQGYASLNHRLTLQTNGVGSATTLLTYDPLGNLLSKTTGQGGAANPSALAQTLYGYDALHRLTQQTDAAGSSTARTTLLTYDPLGDLLSKTTGLAAGHPADTTLYAYDLLGLDPADRRPGSSVARTTTLSLDAAGNVLAKSSGQSGNAAYAQVAVTDYAYDALNRVYLGSRRRRHDGADRVNHGLRRRRQSDLQDHRSVDQPRLRPCSDDRIRLRRPAPADAADRRRGHRPAPGHRA